MLGDEKKSAILAKGEKTLRLKKHAKRLLPKFILNRIAIRRRLQNGRSLARWQLITLAEKKRQFDEFMRRWIKHRDPLAKTEAQKRLAEMRKIIGQLASWPDWASSKSSVQKMQIPGWRQAAASKSRRR